MLKAGGTCGFSAQTLRSIRRGAHVSPASARASNPAAPPSGITHASDDAPSLIHTRASSEAALRRRVDRPPERRSHQARHDTGKVSHGDHGGYPLIRARVSLTIAIPHGIAPQSPYRSESRSRTSSRKPTIGAKLLPRTPLGSLGRAATRSPFQRDSRAHGERLRCAPPSRPNVPAVVRPMLGLTGATRGPRATLRILLCARCGLGRRMRRGRAVG